jgi:outer membrane cobalamin receptor
MRLAATILSGLLMGVATAGSGLAQHVATTRSPDDVEDLEDLPLELLLDTEIGVSALREEKVRKASGVVTVITSDEILASGARNLIDVLQLVPGFSFHADVQGAVGVGFRGNWGHEGKVLLLIDGVEWNEMLDSTAPIEDRIPIDQIERIEIIRGPGSVVYGGWAELAVIHVITRRGNDRGATVRATYGTDGSRGTRSTISGSIGQVVRSLDDLAVSGTFLLGQGVRSSGTYRDFDGNTIDMAEESTFTPAFAAVAATWRDLRVRYLLDRHTAEDRTGLDEALPQTTSVRFSTQATDAQYDLRLGDGVTLTPRLAYLRQTPWQVTDMTSPVFYDKTAERWSAALVLTADLDEHAHIMAGTQLAMTKGWLRAPGGNGLQVEFEGGEASFRSVAGFAQVVIEQPLADLTFGLRGEKRTAFDSSFVPRIGLTRVIDDFHGKLLYSAAFRAPGLENINLGDHVRPELTHTFEAEVGYRLDTRLALTANAFDITIRDPIIYFVDDAGEGYRNYSRSGTRGVEMEARGGGSRLKGSLSYSFASATDKNEVPLYAVPGRDDVMLGMAKHKVTATAQATLARGLVFAPSAVYLGSRHGYLSADESGMPVLGEEDPDLLLNVYLRWRDAGIPGLELGAGVFDVLGSGQRYIQPYDAGHAPLPAMSRELVVRAGYSVSL